MTTEFHLIRDVFLGLTQHGTDVVTGIGDDCATVAPPPGYHIALTTDSLVRGVHFPESTAAPDVGWKALACSLSDLAAAGAQPAWCLLALSLPTVDEDWLHGFAQGFAELARTSATSLIGGDLVRGSELSVTVQAGGYLPSEGGHSRRLASPGDDIYVSGYPGEAAAALALGPQGADSGLWQRLARPRPRTALGVALRGYATACIDVSDGLSADLHHILAASGVGACLERTAIPVSATLAAAADPDRVQHWILEGGDDYELLFTAPVALRGAIEPLNEQSVPISRIGSIEAATGLRVRERDGTIVAYRPGGYEHFAHG